MKLAVSGKGGVGKTSVTVWLADFLARQGEEVWLVDADTALSLGQALGLADEEIPLPLVQEKDLIRERVGEGFIQLNPLVSDLPEKLARKVGRIRLLVMGTIATAGSGCACSPNALLKALLAHLIMDRKEWLIVDLEAGVEHLGRGTIQAVDGLVVVSEPSLRSLQTAARISELARDLGLTKQTLVLNRVEEGTSIPSLTGLPPLSATIPVLPSLLARQLGSSSVLELKERELLDEVARKIIAAFN